MYGLVTGHSLIPHGLIYVRVRRRNDKDTLKDIELPFSQGKC